MIFFIVIGLILLITAVFTFTKPGQDIKNNILNFDLPSFPKKSILSKKYLN